ncbi:HK97-gp10 family putative phage morphogenesis protein [Carnobacterium maltaromaticum]|uniref:HK97-gp10 family putative phage morphogenesis protein n=1 Tax=Carnobacterium maltaromaticum TaxID=2751 RepID=UPI0012FBB19F|nr:HK97-gp10 family putative phage morphogenesis protein [Carnobacterium maltaromaticum]
MTTGLSECLRNLTKLQVNAPRYARKAVEEGAEYFAEVLRAETPSDEGELKEDVHVSGFKGANQGLIEKDIGYGKSTGYRAKFPDSGTINQRPQNFIEDSQKTATPRIQEIYVENLKKGLKF